MTQPKSSEADSLAVAMKPRDLYVDEVWEMYEAASYIGIRNAKTHRKIAQVVLGAKDLDAARKVAAAPELLKALETLIVARDTLEAALHSPYSPSVPDSAYERDERIRAASLREAEAEKQARAAIAKTRA